MPENVLPIVLVLTAVSTLFLTLVLFFVIRISGRVAKVECLLAGRTEKSGSDVSALAPSSAESSAGGAFEAFLNEDQSRRGLPKGDQFKAYRKWRQENGLNWTNS